MTKKDLITEVNVTELLKIAKQSEHQYNAVVKQNKELQSELREVQNENFLLKDAFETYKKESEKFQKCFNYIRDFIHEEICEPCRELEEDHCDECSYKIILEEISEVCNVDND